MTNKQQPTTNSQAKSSGLVVGCWSSVVGVPARRSAPRGYTLIELIVVVAIMSLTVVAIVAALIAFYRSNSAIFTRGYALESARYGINIAVADLRGAQYGADGSYPLASIGPYAVTFYTDTNGDGITERVEYYLSGASLLRGVTRASGTPPAYPSNADATTTVAASLDNSADAVPVFTFYAADGTQITALSTTHPVAYVSLSLIVNGGTQTGSNEYTLRSTAALRNASQF